MSQATTETRLTTKTPEAAFLRVLQDEFNLSLRVSREVLSAAQEMLTGNVPAGRCAPGRKAGVRFGW